MSGLLVMLDTNIVSDLIRNPCGPASRHVERRGTSRVCVSVVTAAELRYGGQKKGSARLVEDIDGVLARVVVLAFQPPADAYYARVRDQLTKAGTPIGPLDFLIAAHALSLDLTLATANVGEFARVAGLRVENWLD